MLQLASSSMWIQCLACCGAWQSVNKNKDSHLVSNIGLLEVLVKKNIEDHMDVR